MFMNTFAMMPSAWGILPPFGDVITSITVQDGVFGDLYASRTPISNWDGTVPTDWDFNTYFNINFNGSLFGGNLPFTADNTSEIRIKRRKRGEFEWQTIYVREINEDADLNFEYYDPLEPAQTEWEYAYVPVDSITGLEGNISMNSIRSEFDGIFLSEIDTTYHAILNVVNSQTLERETATQTTLGRRYPYVIENGLVNYHSGTLQATWMPLVNCQFTTVGDVDYRNQVDAFLSNGKPKILKDWKGNIWLVNIIESIPQQADHPDCPIHSMNWVEVGDWRSAGDLYDAGLINTDIDRR